jgi:hypothetical protein
MCTAQSLINIVDAEGIAKYSDVFGCSVADRGSSLPASLAQDLEIAEGWLASLTTRRCWGAKLRRRPHDYPQTASTTEMQEMWLH